MNDPEQELVRAIGPWTLGANAVNLTVGAGIFALPAVVAAILGPTALLAYLVCGVLVLLVMACFAEVGSQVTRSGGAVAYIDEAFGPMAGLHRVGRLRPRVLRGLGRRHRARPDGRRRHRRSRPVRRGAARARLRAPLRRAGLCQYPRRTPGRAGGGRGHRGQAAPASPAPGRRRLRGAGREPRLGRLADRSGSSAPVPCSSSLRSAAWRAR